MPARILPFVGSSEPLARFVENLEMAGSSDVTVLLTGESGTGKTSAARMLHEMGRRRDRPLRTANVASLSPTLVEGILFGHERGAFTDAHQARPGLFRGANGGTVVLDDVDLLPLDTQVKLLRVLQERVVEPVGASQPVPVDVRVVATTNADLLEAVHAGRFREDLYYRIAVVQLEVPPLRARREDLPELVRALARRAARRAGVRERPISEGAMKRLVEHPWPGNVRELENAIERVLVLVGPSGSGGPRVGSANGTGGARGDGAAPPIEADEFAFLDEGLRGAPGEIAGEALRHGLTVDELAYAMMVRALEEHRGNVSAAARRVGLTRRAFDYRMAQRAKQDESARADEDASA